MQASRLNLLSKEKRRHLQQMVYVQFSKYMLEIILLIITLFGVALVGSEQVLQSYFQSISKPATANIEKLQAINAQVSFINTTVEQTDVIQSLSPRWTILLQELAAQTPDDITLTGIRIQKSTGQLSLTGEASSRDALLLFQQSLESISWIESAIIPLSQLTEKEAFPFSITATLESL